VKLIVNGKEVDAVQVKIKTKFFKDKRTEKPLYSRVYFNKTALRKLGFDEGDVITVYFMNNGRLLTSYNFTVKSGDGGLRYIEIPALLTEALKLGLEHKKALVFRAGDTGIVFILR